MEHNCLENAQNIKKMKTYIKQTTRKIVSYMIIIEICTSKKLLLPTKHVSCFADTFSFQFFAAIILDDVFSWNKISYSGHCHLIIGKVQVFQFGGMLCEFLLF